MGHKQTYEQKGHAGKKKIFFTSDTHFHHTNIVHGISRWPEANKARGCRPFQLLDEMDEELILKINHAVGADDTLYHLGDWSFGGFEKIQEFRNKINCKTIHLILGNHDHHIENNHDNIQRIFSSVSHYKEINIHGQKIILSHYPFKEWHKSYDGSWMLYGHCHNSCPDDAIWLEGKHKNAYGRKTMDVGVDTNNFYPYSFHDLVEIMKDRGIDKNEQAVISNI